VREVAALFNVHRATLYRALAVVPSPTRVRTRV
jgi:hypothetical protein